MPRVKFPPDFQAPKSKCLTAPLCYQNIYKKGSWLSKRASVSKVLYFKNLKGSQVVSHCCSTHRSCTGCMYSFRNLFNSALRGWSPFSIAIRSASVGSGSGISNLAQKVGISTSHRLN